MLVLSILIMLALAVAVASFFIATAQWLLFASAALVILAFYLSRRASRAVLESGSERDRAPISPARERLIVTIDERILESGRHRDQPMIDGRAEVDDAPPRSGGRVAS